MSAFAPNGVSDLHFIHFSKSPYIYMTEYMLAQAYTTFDSFSAEQSCCVHQIRPIKFPGVTGLPTPPPRSLFPRNQVVSDNTIQQYMDSRDPENDIRGSR